MDRVGPLFVVEDEHEMVGGPQDELPTWERDITGQWAALEITVGGQNLGRLGCCRRRIFHRKTRGRIGQSLSGVSERLSMHVLMEQGQEMKIQDPIRKGAWTGVLEMLQHAIQHAVHVGEGFSPGQEGKIPTCFVRHGPRVVQSISLVEDWPFPPQMPQRPLLLKPGDVPDLPQQWIDDLQARPEKLLVLEVGEQIVRAPPRISQHAAELSGRYHKNIIRPFRLEVP